MASFVPPPAPSLNGGLYTGIPFMRGAPWGNLPATPDAGYMSLVNLQSADPPHLGPFHLPGGGLRPGNNTPLLPHEWTDRRVPELGLVCIPDVHSLGPFGKVSQSQGTFRAHAYLPVADRAHWRACSS
jgi:hypothetical protein